MGEVVRFPGAASKADDLSFDLADEVGKPKSATAMEKAISWLNEANVTFFQPTGIQLKIQGGISFYPNKGTINFDNQRALKQRGLHGLREVLQKNLNRELPPIA